MDKILLDWFDAQPLWKQSDVVNDNKFATFREKLRWHFEQSPEFKG